MPTDLPPVLNPSGLALFLDFDGTLTWFADHPDDVMVTEGLIGALAQLNELTSGALAIITGRDIAAIDKFLAPLTLPVAGVHGLVRRDPAGAIHRAQIDLTALAHIAGRLDRFASSHAGLLVERKAGSVALHYRLAPDLADACATAMAEAVSHVQGFKVLRGNAVFEARTEGHDKGTAIAEFLAEPPFAARIAVFAGDDVTDEDGFRTINELGPARGISIKVGAGESKARYRVANVEALHDWLDALIAAAR